MRHLNPEKLYVQYLDGVYGDGPITPRKYTLFHSNRTGDLFLTIDGDYKYNRISPQREEIFAEWVEDGKDYQLHIFCDVDGVNSSFSKAQRLAIFRNEMPLVLEALRYGDKTVYKISPELEQAYIFIHFVSESSLYNAIEKWGTPSLYRIS